MTIRSGYFPHLVGVMLGGWIGEGIRRIGLTTTTPFTLALLRSIADKR